MTYEIILGRGEKERAKLGLQGTVLLGKHYVQMGQTTSLSNKVYLDVASTHVIFVCGKRGGGKCLTGDTLITLGNGEVVPIADLEHRQESILALGQNLKIQHAYRDGFFKRKVQTVVKVALRTGKQITLTPEHPLFTVVGWQEVRNLTIGSRIATPRVTPVFGDKSLPEQQVKLIAYLLAEGHLSNQKILFTNSDDQIVADFKESVFRFDDKLKIVNHGEYGYSVVNRGSITKIIQEHRDEKGRFTPNTKMTHRSQMRSWLEQFSMYDKLSRQKEIPSCIYTIPKRLLSLFLNRLFSCDGSILRRENLAWEVSYASSSKKLIDAVAHLLLRFGIVSKVRTKTSKKYGTQNYELEINGEFVNTYLQEIGFFGKKEIRAKQALHDSLQVIRNPNIDTIPKEIWESYAPRSWAEVGREMGYKYPKALRESMRYSPSRQKLLQIAVLDDNEQIAQLANSDIFWDEIVSMERIDGECSVYDISVPESHNFVANDIIVHNSYSLGVIAEGMSQLPEEVKDNASVIIFDTMGIFWTMKYPNREDRSLLEQWELKPQGLDVTIFTPKDMHEKLKAQGIPSDRPFSINPAQLSPQDWWEVFELSQTQPLAIFIERLILSMQDKSGAYAVRDIINVIKKERTEESSVVQAALNRFESADRWGLFDPEATPIDELALPGKVAILDLSVYATMPGGWRVRALVIAIVSQKLFEERMAARKQEEIASVKSEKVWGFEDNTPKKLPLVWLIIDEAHEFLPNDQKTVCTDALITILREGRQPGISLVLASQQPGKIHTDVLTQSDIVLSHQITAKIDTDALQALTQSYMREGLDKQLNLLPKESGAAVVLDDKNERVYAIRVRPRLSWHGGETATALKDEKKLFTM